jgi:hypothetical protein
MKYAMFSTADGRLVDIIDQAPNTSGDASFLFSQSAALVEFCEANTSASEIYLSVKRDPSAVPVASGEAYVVLVPRAVGGE